MTFELGHRVAGNKKFLTMSKIFVGAAIAVVIALVQLSAFSTSAEAAAPKATTAITTCPKAITSMNSTLVLIAKRRVALRATKGKGAKRVKKAKKSLKSAQKQGNNVRAAITKYCLGANGLSALDAQCTVAISSLSASINLAYTRKIAYKKIKGKSAKAKKKKRVMKTQLKRLNDKIAAQTANFSKACGGNVKASSVPTTPGGNTTTPADTTAPGGVELSGPSGTINDNTPTFTITPPAGETGGHIECAIDGGTYVTVTSPFTTSALSDGVHTVSCRYVDQAGNEGSASTITVTIDTTAPSAPTISGPSTTNDSTPTFTLGGAGAGEQYICGVDTVETFAPTSEEFTTQILTEGSHDVNCLIVDEAGNGSDVTTKTVQYDKTAPGTTTITGPGTTNDPTPTITVTPPAGETGGYIECKIDGGAFATVTSPWTLPTLSEGTHTITCHYVDGAGNVGPDTTYTITIDTIGPGAPTVTTPKSPTNDNTPAITVTKAETGGSIECKTDSGSYSTVSSPFSTSTLADGSHVVTCRQIDGAGNTGSTGQVTVVVDTTAPGLVTISGPAGATSDTTPSFNLSGAGVGDTYQCKTDGGAFVTTTTPYTTAALSDGSHTVTCHLTDAAGNVGGNTTATVSIDSSAPGSVTITGPTGPTNNPNPVITITPSETGGHIECKIDNGAFQTVTSPWTLPTLSEGTHTITCHYVDGAGNTGPDTTYTITIDTTAPSAITVTGPTGLITDNTPTYTITGGGSGAIFQCKIDGGNYATVASPYTTAALSDGAHTVTCRAIDAAGNANTPVVKTITVDTSAPTLTVTDGTPKWDGTHQFNLASSETATFKCGIDGAAATTVTTPYTTGVLANGSHSISCTAADAAGNVSAPVVKGFGVFKDPTVVSKSGGFQWGLACTGNTFLNSLLGCPDDSLSITIPANPNGLTGSYLVDLSAQIDNLTGVLGIGSKYTMYIAVDGASVASDSQTVIFDLLGLCGADLAASKSNLSLSSATAHTIKLSLKTSSLINVLPSVKSSNLSVSIHH